MRAPPRITVPPKYAEYFVFVQLGALILKVRGRKTFNRYLSEIEDFSKH